MGKNINCDTSFLTSWIHFASCKPLRLESTPPNTSQQSEKVGVKWRLLFHHSHDVLLLFRHQRNASWLAVFAHVSLSGKRKKKAIKIFKR